MTIGIGRYCDLNIFFRQAPNQFLAQRLERLNIHILYKYLRRFRISECVFVFHIALRF